MRKIAVIAISLLALAAVGCSKKSEEHAAEESNQNMTAPAAPQEAPAFMEQSEETMDNTEEHTQEGNAPADGK